MAKNEAPSVSERIALAKARANGSTAPASDPKKDERAQEVALERATALSLMPAGSPESIVIPVKTGDVTLAMVTCYPKIFSSGRIGYWGQANAYLKGRKGKVAVTYTLD